MAQINFGGTVEEVITREEYPIDKAREMLKDEVIAVIGYGPQGYGQSLNLRDNGVNVIVGQREGGKGWDNAIKDGWVPGKNLFKNIEEAIGKATIVQYLLSDAGQKEQWPMVKKCLKKGQALYFSHGFSIVFKDQTNVIPPEDVDVILVAPKGSGRTVRTNFIAGSGINASFAVFQDFTGKARQRAIACGIAIGSGYLFPTTFEKEVRSDLYGERGVLMGAIAGLMKAQYDVLRANGHSPSEAFNETVEEATQSLYPLIGQNGMDWMFSNCSTTAQRGALDWAKRFEMTNRPLFELLYRDTKEGVESRRVLDTCGAADYRQKLDAELAEWGDSEMWQAGKAVRSLRPENWKK
jgi:ketol-acid reductoisomerase